MKLKVKQGSIALLLAVLLFGCQASSWQPAVSQTPSSLGVQQAITPDPQIEATIVPYRQELTAIMNEVLGTSSAYMVKTDYQSPLGYLLMDLMMQQALKRYDKPIDFSVTNRDGLRAPLPAGEIRLQHAYALLPFDNELVVLTLDGQTVKEIFDFAASQKHIYIGHASYTIRNGKATAITINGKPLDPAKTYTLVTTDYLADGGDYMAMLTRASSYEKTGLKQRDAFINYVREQTAKGLPVTPDSTNRVTILP